MLVVSQKRQRHSCGNHALANDCDAIASATFDELRCGTQRILVLHLDVRFQALGFPPLIRFGIVRPAAGEEYAKAVRKRDEPPEVSAARGPLANDFDTIV